MMFHGSVVCVNVTKYHQVQWIVQFFVHENLKRKYFSADCKVICKADCKAVDTSEPQVWIETGGARALF